MPKIAPALRSLREVVLLVESSAAAVGEAVVRPWAPKVEDRVMTALVPQQEVEVPQHQVVLSGGQGVMAMSPWASTPVYNGSVCQHVLAERQESFRSGI